MELLICSVILLCVASYQFILYPLYLSPLAKIPNAHPLAAVSSLWIQWQRFQNKEFKSVAQAFEVNGPFVRLGPKEFAMNSMEGGVRKVYGFGQDNFDKSPWYDFFKNHGSRNTFCALGQDHAVHRRRVSVVYSKSFIQNSPHIRAIFSDVLQERLLPLISDVAATGSPIDVLSLNLAYGLDFVSAFIFGLSRGVRFIENEKDRRDWFNLYDRAHPTKYSFWILEYPNFSKFLARTGLPLIPKGFNEAKIEFEKWGSDRVRLAEQTLSSHKYPENGPISAGEMPLLYQQIKTGMAAERSVKDGEFFSPSSNETLELASECLDHMVATRDTFGISFSYVIFMISQNPQTQKDLRSELLSISNPFYFPNNESKQIPSAKALEALPLLDAVIKESLRLRNTGPTLNPRISPAGRNTTIGPLENIPPGVTVGAYAWCLHRNEEGFPEPEKWEPKRWLVDARSDAAIKRDKWFWAFGSGSRQCLGQSLAMEMMRFAVAAIYTNFTTTVIGDTAFAADGFVCGDGSEQLVIKFERIEVEL